MWALLEAMRPHQWVKNLFVLAPLVFAEQALAVEHVLHALAAFALFSVLSGCVYILNDLMDIESDRRHPVKCQRPLAAGRLSVTVARTALGGMLVGVVAVSFVAFPLGFVATGLAYFTLNVAYSFSLKHIPFLDVVTIATGFVLRLIGGATAVAVPITGWIVGTTFVLAVTLALGKRRHEILQAGARGEGQRKVLARYALAHVDVAMRVGAVLTVLSYAAYVAWGSASGRLFDPRDLVWTIPCVVFGIYRFVRLTERAEDGRSPTDLMLRDRPFLANLALWSLVVVVVIYAH